MKRLVPVILGLAFFLGCSKLSTDFQKSGRSAFIMIQQAEDGAPVLRADLSRAFIEMKYAAKTANDKRAMEILTFYRDEYLSLDDTPASKKALSDCRTAAEEIFIHGADPDEAGKPCDNSIIARGDAIIKQMNEEDRKQHASQ
ncbi:MAG TPA: hypothetical protein VFP59_14030 [Candidatus Angelobacter sp.]|nr:hypothetical protein [Candidatus Angelobacter sp.]